MILCTSGCEGKRSDIKLLRDSKVRFKKGTCSLADSGYQGIHERHSNALIPKKKSKHNPLMKEDKRYNRMLSGERIDVENVIGWMKRFRILTERYRNRRRRFGLRFNLIAGIYNYELKQ